MIKKNRYDSSRKADTSSLKEVIAQYLEFYKLKGKISQTNLMESWEKIMGKAISTRTSKLYIQNKVMFVNLTSAPLKNELSMSKARIVQLLEESLGEKVIDDIVFL